MDKKVLLWSVVQCQGQLTFQCVFKVWGAPYCWEDMTGGTRRPGGHFQGNDVRTTLLFYLYFINFVLFEGNEM